MLTSQPNSLQTKYEKKSSLSISILITGVNDTGDKSLYMIIFKYIYKNSKRLKLYHKGLGWSQFVKKTKSKKSGVRVSLK